MKLKPYLAGLLIALASFSTHLQAQVAQLNVASYNLRYDNEEDQKNGNGWEKRMPVIANMIRFHGMDLIGTQEGLQHQLTELKDFLPNYEYIGVGRDNGVSEGEYSAIFYRNDIYELLDNGNFWLSQTPDVPGKGWDAACTRICTWGKFKEKNSGLEFMVFNLHMDHEGEKARKESVTLVQQKIKELSNGLPVILTGDFNADQTESVYRTLTQTGTLVDTYEKSATRYAVNGTFNNFNPDGYNDSRIDHVFVSPAFKIKKYGILTDTYPDLMTKAVKKKKKADSGKQPKIKFKQKGAYRDPNSKIKGPTFEKVEEQKVIGHMARVPSDHYPVVATLEYEM